MPYEYRERDYEPETQASSSRGGNPPHKITGIGVLDPPVPPKRQPTPTSSIPASRLVRIFAVMLLIGLFVSAILLLLPWR